MANTPSLRQTYADELRFTNPRSDVEQSLIEAIQKLADSITYTRPIVTFTENVQPGDQVELFDDTPGLCARLATASVPRFAFGFVSATTPILAGNTGEVTLAGNNLYLTGLVPGQVYYLSDTPGQISTTPGTSEQFVGLAISEGTLFQNFSTAFTGFLSLDSIGDNLYGTGLDPKNLARRAPGQRIITANHTVVASDSGITIFHPASDTSTRNIFIPANAGLPLPISTRIRVINEEGAGNVNINVLADDLDWIGNAATGSRTLAPDGWADLEKVKATKWVITGIGLT